jgi:hypothetical protein
MAGTISGNERFLRENRDPGQMVGGEVSGVGNLRGATDGSSASMANPLGAASSRTSSMSPFNSMFNQGMMNSMNSMSRRRQLRVPLRLGLDISSPATPIAVPAYTGPNTALQTRLAKIPQLKGLRSVTVEMEGRTAVLKGEVTTQYQRDLAGKLVLLEPGIAAGRGSTGSSVRAALISPLGSLAGVDIPASGSWVTPANDSPVLGCIAAASLAADWISRRVVVIGNGIVVARTRCWLDRVGTNWCDCCQLSRAGTDGVAVSL